MNQQFHDENSSSLRNHFAIWFTIALFSLTCCFPFGVVAVYFGTKVWDAKSRKDTQSADENIKKMKLWMWIAIGLGILFHIVSSILPSLLQMK